MRVIRPFLVTDATVWPRSSPHVTHICSTLSPIVKVFLSVILLLDSFLSVRVINPDNETPPVVLGPRAFSRFAGKKNLTSAAGDHYGHRRSPGDYHHRRDFRRSHGCHRRRR